MSGVREGGRIVGGRRGGGKKEGAKEEDLEEEEEDWDCCASFRLAVVRLKR